MRPAPRSIVTSALGSSDAGGQDAARAVILERSADQMNAVRQQRGGQRVAGEALIAPAVEGESKRRVAIDAAA